jgi:hypothetical protein
MAERAIVLLVCVVRTERIRNLSIDMIGGASGNKSSSALSVAVAGAARRFGSGSDAWNPSAVPQLSNLLQDDGYYW